MRAARSTCTPSRTSRRSTTCSRDLDDHVDEPRPLRVQLGAEHPVGADQAQPPHRRAGPAPTPLARGPRRHADQQRRLRSRDAGRPPAQRPAAEGGQAPAVHGSGRLHRRQLQGVRQPAPRALLRDGVRHPARGAAGGVRPAADAGRPPGPLHRLPGGGPLRRPATTSPVDRVRPRHRVRGLPRLQGHALRPVLPGRRGDHERLRRPPPLGEDALPDRRDAGAALPPLGRLPGGPRAGSTRRAPSPTATSTASSDRSAADRRSSAPVRRVASCGGPSGPVARWGPRRWGPIGQTSGQG